MLSTIQQQGGVQNLDKERTKTKLQWVQKDRNQYLNNFGKDHQRKKFSKGNVNQLTKSQTTSKPMDFNNKKTSGIKERESMKCWGCGEPHLLREFSHYPKSIRNIQVVHKETIMNGVSKNIPKISTMLDDRQDEHQPTRIEIEGTISNQSLYVLIAPGECLSYISPQLVEKCQPKFENFKATWLEWLSASTKTKVTSQLRECPINLNGQ